MPDIEILDPLGRRITLHDRTWFGHILAGHPDMAEHRDRAAEAIRNPAEIRVSRADKDCRLYYAAGPRPGRMIVVVADVELGLVKTAHIAAPPGPGKGEIEWSPPTPSKEP
jgi:hypothetical protein